jgi:CheY-like chemotaxis protein
MQGDLVPLANLRVLVVEDESIVAMMIEEFLIELGCIVVGSAARLGQALELARSVEVDMAVLDLNLAGEMSYPVAELLRARGVPVIFATGYGSDGLSERFNDSRVLPKPYNMLQLADALRAKCPRR